MLPLALCLLTGCLRCYYPSVSFVPPPTILELPSDVHVFRVDRSHDGHEFPIVEKEILTELSPTEQWVPQIKLALDSKFYLLPGLVIMGYVGDSWERMEVRLYRPGWKTVTLSSWDVAPTVRWEKADTWFEQERALLALTSSFHAAPASATPAHRDALHFIAGEYERLANQVGSNPDDPEMQQRLRNEASNLREK